jgi:RHS repeat-associated protein
MTDVNGTLVYKGQFDPYGQVLMEWGSASLNTKKFTGYERDGATGLDYAGARMYNSGRGRFMQPDPAGLKAANLGHPLSLNRYAYVYNDPANLIDPGGMFAGMFGCFLLGFGGGDGWSYDEYRCFASMWIPGIPTGAFDFNIPVVGSQDPYNGLTQDEKILCILHPEVCSRVAWARADALQERQRRYGDTGDNDDWCDNAFLHAYWNARMVQLISALPSDPFYIGSTAVEMAKAFADAHEARPNNPVEEQQMDFWNNNVGRIIATQNPNATPEQLAELIQNEVNAGRVLVMDGNGIAPRHPRPGECDPND